MTQEKKLQDFLTDAKVPRDARDAIPLFVSPRGIVWVGGLRVAEWAKSQPGCPTVCLSYRPA
jgi:tRNA(Ile)-lysidine synthase